MSFFCPYTTCPILQNERLQRPFAILRTDDIEKPKTNADRIRIMSDEELAILFTTLISEIENDIMEKLKQAGVDADLIEFPIASLQSQLEYLQAEETE